jgi:hypothetical protein
MDNRCLRIPNDDATRPGDPCGEIVLFEIGGANEGLIKPTDAEGPASSDAEIGAYHASHGTRLWKLQRRATHLFRITERHATHALARLDHIPGDRPDLVSSVVSDMSRREV